MESLAVSHSDTGRPQGYRRIDEACHGTHQIHQYDEFRVDTVLLEYELFNGFMGFDKGSVHENGLALKMRLKA